MSRWIDADAIKDKAWKAESEACFYALEDVVSVTDIDEAPSIDIVRCGECKHFKQGVRFNKPRYTDIENFCAYHMVFGWNANAFCSYGERKDNE